MALKYPEKAEAWAHRCLFSLTCVLGQETANYGPLARFGGHLFLEIKFYWSTTTCLCLGIIYSWFCATSYNVWQLRCQSWLQSALRVPGFHISVFKQLDPRLVESADVNLMETVGHVLIALHHFIKAIWAPEESGTPGSSRNQPSPRWTPRDNYSCDTNCIPAK